jgi:release factor glutamine methyltransferase
MSATPARASQSSRSSALVAVTAQLRTAGCVFAEAEAEIILSTADTTADLATMIEQRVAGLPLEHIVGWAEFCGLRISVGPGVFVPRRRTEFLVHQVLGPDGPAGVQATVPVVVDLCCGSGAVGAALAARLGRLELHAVDIDPAAVSWARTNLLAAGARVYQGDLDEPLPRRLRGRVDVLVANAPYVPTEAIRLLPPEARVHEPPVALDGGYDGLEVLRRVIAAAPAWLAPGGQVLVETSRRQAPELLDVVATNGLIPRQANSEVLGATVVIGTRLPAATPPPVATLTRR